MDDSLIKETPLILLVDDDPMIRMLVRESLLQRGFAVEEAEDGESALDALKECHPDAILLDVLMPYCLMYLCRESMALRYVRHCVSCRRANIYRS